MRTINLKLKDKDLFCVLVFFAMAIAIYSKSYFNFHGNLSADSMRYLEISQNLVDGNGFLYTSDHQSATAMPSARVFPATWPLAYPICIFLISKITGVTVFWSSKLLGILMIGLIIVLFRILFQEKAYVYSLIFLFSSFLEIFSYTWSEGLFIFFLVLFSMSIYRLLLYQNNLLLISFSLLSSSLIMFLTRYIGAFSLIIMGLLGIYLLLIKKDLLRSSLLISVTIISFIIMIAYLYNNYLLTGLITGRQRFIEPEPIIHYLFTTLWVLTTEINILSINTGVKGPILLLLQFIIIGFIVFKNKKIIFDKNNYINNKNELLCPLVFSLIGLFYLFVIISIRFLGFRIDALGFRLLAPGTLLLFIALIKYIDIRSKKIIFHIFIKALFILTLCSWIICVPMKIIKNYNNTNYLDTVNRINTKYANVTNNSIVVFGERDLKYLRPNIEIRNPISSINPDERESWSNFIKRINILNKNIYLVIPPENFSLNNFDESIRKIINENKYAKLSLVKM